VIHKNTHALFPLLLGQKLTDFHNSFTVRFTRKYTMCPSQKISPHLKRVTTLPCETRMLKITPNFHYSVTINLLC